MAPSAERGERHRDISRLTKLLVGVCVVVSNIVGAGVVLVLAAYVLPTQAMVADQTDAVSRNVTVFAAYLVVAVLVGIGWGRAWVRIPSAPAPDADHDAWARHRRRARRVVLGAPFRLAIVQAVPWSVAFVLFVALNASYSLLLAVVVACVVALGGLSTVAVAYRLTELAMRREVARVLAEDPPSGLALPGVGARLLGGWLLGTGVPLLGVVLIAATSFLVPGYYSVLRLGIVMLALSLVALTVGFLLIALTSTSISGPIVGVRRALQRVERGDLDVTVRVSDATELGLLQAGFNTMVGGLRERDRVRALFGRHVGEDVAQAAVDSDELELGGEVRDVAVLFVDLIGSTALALEREPYEVVDILNRFFSEVIGAVEDHQGWINKFEGDAALAVFGAPSALRDPAGCALAAARDMASRLGRVDEVAAGIGVSAGPAVAGNIGDPRRYEYTVIGDPVNEASRLCDLAKAYPALVAASGVAVARADDREASRWQVVDSQQLRGRDAETEVAVPADTVT